MGAILITSCRPPKKKSVENTAYVMPSRPITLDKLSQVFMNAELKSSKEQAYEYNWSK